MRAMVMEQTNSPLQLKDCPIPKAQDRQILIQVTACGICRTDLHVIDGDLTEPKQP